MRPTVRCVRSLSYTASTRQLWKSLVKAPADPILGINEDFKRDTNPHKVNLSIGAYRDEQGEAIILPSIRMASLELVKHQTHKEYTGINGSDNFRNSVKQFLFGGIPTGAKFLGQDRISIAQSLSGTGALRLAGEFWKKFNPSKDTTEKIYIPNPTWSNHVNIFTDSGLQPVYYTYFSGQTNSIDFGGLLRDLRSADEGSLVLLHACCHNPTGLDPTQQQWQDILRVVVERQLVPVLDIAYQGFVNGNLVDDLYLLEEILQRIDRNELETVLICQSFAKNMGLYGERIGSLSILTPNAAKTEAVDSQLKKIIRAIYSSPSIHGSELVEIVLCNAAIRKQWEADVYEMAVRIKQMRHDLYAALTATHSSRNWDHIVNQNGMFCYTGLSEAQIVRLRDEFSIYATLDGRISISGINKSNVQYLSDAFLAVVEH